MTHQALRAEHAGPFEWPINHPPIASAAVVDICTLSINNIRAAIHEGDLQKEDLKFVSAIL